MARLKKSDIVVCVDVDPPADAPKNTLARRKLVIGETYEVIQDEGSFGGVRVAQRADCSCHPASMWSLTGPFQHVFHAYRFHKLGSIK